MRCTNGATSPPHYRIQFVREQGSFKIYETSFSRVRDSFKTSPTCKMEQQPRRDGGKRGLLTSQTGKTYLSLVADSSPCLLTCLVLHRTTRSRYVHSDFLLSGSPDTRTRRSPRRKRRVRSASAIAPAAAKHARVCSQHYPKC